VHQGVSYARNLVLAAAKDEYVGFVDADDYVDQDMFASMLESMARDKSDWVVCNVKLHDSNGTQYDRLKFNDSVLKLEDDRKSFLNDLFDFRYDYAVWNKLYKKSLGSV
jgi:glycosyltransferase involved in cell wall biosynthesis